MLYIAADFNVGFNDDDIGVDEGTQAVSAVRNYRNVFIIDIENGYFWLKWASF